MHVGKELWIIFSPPPSDGTVGATMVSERGGSESAAAVRVHFCMTGSLQVDNKPPRFSGPDVRSLGIHEWGWGAAIPSHTDGIAWEEDIEMEPMLCHIHRREA